MADKNVDAITQALFPLFDLIITTEPYPPRNASAESLALTARRLGISTEAWPDVRQALQRALEASPPVVVVGGSLYLAGAAIEHFDAHGKHQRQQQD
jgi:folylpolyglutamate synthase/dihydropteroate synthase